MKERGFRKITAIAGILFSNFLLVSVWSVGFSSDLYIHYTGLSQPFRGNHSTVLITEQRLYSGRRKYQYNEDDFRFKFRFLSRF